MEHLGLGFARVGSWHVEVHEKLAESLMNGFQEFPGIHVQYATLVEE